MQGDLTSFSPSVGRHISPTEALCGMAQKKVKVKTLEKTTFLKMLRANMILKSKNSGAKNDVIWDHKYSDSIRVHPNNADSNQLIPDNSKNISPINDSENTSAIENILSWSGKLKETTANPSNMRLMLTHHR